MVEQQEFQIPQQLRELAEKNVEQARVAYGQFLDGMAEAVRACGPEAAEQFCPDADAVLRAAGAGTRPTHDGGHAQRRVKRLSAPIRACPPEFRTVQPRRSGQVRRTP